MKVLMTTDAVGGVWAYALELADALAEHDVEVTLCAMGPRPSADQRVELRSAAVSAAHFGDYALEWMDDPWEDVERAGEWLLGIAEELEPDLVHLNGYAHAALPWETPCIVVGHSDVLSWHEAVRGRPAGAEWRRYLEAVSAGLAGADLLIAPTHAMLDALIRIYDPPCPRVVVTNGLRQRFLPRPKSDLVLTVGRLWDEAKNVQALVRLAPRLPWPVAVVGQGDAGPGVQALGRLGRKELDHLFTTAGIFAEPARYEPFGLAALEAGLAGCALVLGDIPSLREVWGNAAVFVSPADDEELERALRRLISNPKLRADYGDRARRRGRRFSSERMVDGYLSAYRRMLSHDRVPAG